MRNDNNFINNQFFHSDKAELVTVYNPANGAEVATVQAATEVDVLRAIESATQAQKAWRKLTST